MTNFSVKKTVIQGEVSWHYFINGKPVKSFYNCSRELTGTTDEYDRGLFCSKPSYFNYGTHRMSCNFDIPCFTFSVNDTPIERASKILERIKILQEWVTQCKNGDINDSGIVTVTIPLSNEAMEEKLKMYEGKTLYIREGRKFIELNTGTTTL